MRAYNLIGNFTVHESIADTIQELFVYPISKVRMACPACSATAGVGLVCFHKAFDVSGADSEGSGFGDIFESSYTQNFVSWEIFDNFYKICNTVCNLNTYIADSLSYTFLQQVDLLRMNGCKITG